MKESGRIWKGLARSMNSLPKNYNFFFYYKLFEIIIFIENSNDNFLIIFLVIQRQMLILKFISG